ncbi:hypothetical protein HELRODRAFT_89658 [Helobdella robusta]|uniref:Gamma-secretase subunit PEN-2 n=1 Tax=Helobdella robusta TaxID=6412 RepID=T1G7F6_HELRO|nr:hypothetical protein HELRODRAFT_89658 [Helobdella robusta]ESN92306.1 hypothetical protein HELRODRAFT_89658 [Helobdella robusta]
MRKLTSEEKLHICKMYFRIGFFLLPLVWIMNFLWFFKEVFRKTPTPMRKQMRKYLVLSLVGAICYSTLMLIWVIVYNLKRFDWDRFGDKLTLIFPVGEY